MQTFLEHQDIEKLSFDFIITFAVAHFVKILSKSKNKEDLLFNLSQFYKRLIEEIKNVEI